MKNRIVIADSCTLILLAKCSILDAFAEIVPVVIPDAVFREVVNKNLIKRFADSKIISDIVLTGKIKVITIKTPSQKLPFTMGKGESEALLLASQTSGSILATDDGKAIKACRYFKQPFIISPKIVTELYRLDRIDLTKAKKSIEKMKIVGRYSPDIIAEAILELEVTKDAKASHGKG